MQSIQFIDADVIGRDPHLVVFLIVPPNVPLEAHGGAAEGGVGGVSGLYLNSPSGLPAVGEPPSPSPVLDGPRPKPHL